MSAFVRLQRLAWLLVVLFLFFGVAVFFVFTQYAKDFFQPSVLHFPNEAPAPRLHLREEATPKVSAQAYWLYDRKSGSLLAEKNSQTATSVASLAKLMTAYTAYESYVLNDEVRIGSASAVLGNRAKFLSRDVFTVGDLLKAMLIFSANDAAQALAQFHPGGEEGFVEQMNVRSQELGLNSTHFDNSHGIDSPGQYSTAQDIGHLALAVLEIPFLEETVAMPLAVVREQQTGRLDTVYTTNSLLHRSPAIQGMKTGTTELAGESLVIRAEFDPTSATKSAFFARTASDSAHLLHQPPLDLVLVILGSQDRYLDATNLLRWVARNTFWQ